MGILNDRLRVTVGVFATLFDRCGQVVLVKLAYGSNNWAQPGGALERDEDPEAGVLREIREETGFEAKVTAFVGTYVGVSRADIVLHFEAVTINRGAWLPNGEISDVGVFPASTLPIDISPNVVRRLQDGIRRQRGVIHSWSE